MSNRICTFQTSWSSTHHLCIQHFKTHKTLESNYINKLINNQYILIYTHNHKIINKIIIWINRIQNHAFDLNLNLGEEWKHLGSMGERYPWINPHTWILYIRNLVETWGENFGILEALLETLVEAWENLWVLEWLRMRGIAYGRLPCSENIRFRVQNDVV